MEAKNLTKILINAIKSASSQRRASQPLQITDSDYSTPYTRKSERNRDRRDKSHKKDRKKSNNERKIVTKRSKHFLPMHLTHSLSKLNIKIEELLLCTHKDILQAIKLNDLRLKQWRGMVRDFLGTQQPIFRLKTGFTTVSTTTTTLVQVVAMDVSGIPNWSSWATLFDEYRIRVAQLVCQPAYDKSGSAATALYANIMDLVVDYDDSAALASSSQAINYDTHRNVCFSGLKLQFSALAQPEGQPDLAWVTTATPTIPFWFKFYSVSALIPNGTAIGYCHIRLEIEFRQIG